MRVPIEIETCFEMRRKPAARRLMSVLQDLAAGVTGPSRRTLHDTLLDTRDLRLAQAHAALRLRTGDGAPELTLKSLAPFSDGLAVRAEVSERLARLPPSLGPRCPGRRLARQLQPLLGQEPLGACFALDQVRDVYTVRLHGGSTVQVSVDTVRLPGLLRRPVFRLEVELTHGKPAELTRWARALQKALDLVPASGSKYDLGLKALGRERPSIQDPPRPSRHAPLGRVLAYAVQRHANRLRWHEAGVRLDLDPEPVHAMRVACRRLRSALKGFGTFIRPAPCGRLRSGLSALARRLGAVRDLDVHLSALDAGDARMPEGSRRALAAYRQEQSRRRRQAYMRLLSFLDSAAYARLLRELDGFARRCPEADTPSTDVAHELVRRQFKQVRRLGKTLADGASDADWHRLRIRCKRLRYTCEVLLPACAPALAGFVTRLAALQEVLGAHQDEVTGQFLMRAYLAAARQDPAVRRAVEALREQASARRNATRKSCLDAWKRFDRRSVRHRLQQAVG